MRREYKSNKQSKCLGWYVWECPRRERMQDARRNKIKGKSESVVPRLRKLYREPLWRGKTRDPLVHFLHSSLVDPIHQSLPYDVLIDKLLVPFSSLHASQST